MQPCPTAENRSHCAHGNQSFGEKFQLGHGLPRKLKGENDMWLWNNNVGRRSSLDICKNVSHSWVSSSFPKVRNFHSNEAVIREQ